MPSGRKKEVVDERAEKVFSGIQATGSWGVAWGRVYVSAAQSSHDVSSGLILYWKKRCEEASLAEGPSQSEKRFLARIAELERMVGRLTMENELLKKAV